VRRQCARPGCSAVATATFTFDAREQTVWLDTPSEGGARAGELCERHARVLTPPQGWRLDDRRPAPVAPAPPAAPLVPAPTPIDAMLRADSPLLSRAFQAAGGH
jgi:hypothetical protein